MTDNTEAMELWREDWHHLALLVHDYEDVLMNEAVSRLYSSVEAKLAELRAENAKLRNMLVPQWFYADGYSSEDCQDSPDEVLENIDLKPGKHVVSVDCAGPMPKIWCAVRVLTDEEMDALETDDRVSFTEHDSEDAARQALEADHGA